MKRSKFTEKQVVFALKQVESGVTKTKIYRKLGVTKNTFSNLGKALRTRRVRPAPSQSA